MEQSGGSRADEPAEAVERREGAPPAADRDSAAPPAEERRGAPPPGRSEPKPPREGRGVGVWSSVLGFLAAAAAFLVFVVQNTETVHVDWTVWSVGVSLAAVVFGAMLLGSALTLALGAIWRIRRRRRHREREELHRLRAGAR